MFTLLSKIWLNRPVRWGVAYILSMVLFGALYSLMTRDFVQSTIKFDPRFQVVNDEIFDLSGQLLSAIVGQPFGDDNPSTYMALNNGIAQRNDRSVVMNGSVYRQREVFDLQFMFYVGESYLAIRALDINAQKAINWLTVSKFNTVEEMIANGLNPATWKENDAFVHTIRLEDQGPLRSRIIEWIAAQDSYVASGGNGLVRMLYFSVVTATTLGYGDIIPVSDKARVLVSLQTVLSVICIGLFLNSVAVKGRRND